MLFGFRKVQSKVGAWTGYFLNVLMLNELNVDRPDEGVHHEADQPAHLQRNAISLFVSSSRGAAVSKYYFFIFSINWVCQLLAGLHQRPILLQAKTSPGDGLVFSFGKVANL